MPQQIQLDLKPDVERRLTALPTATTYTERKLALHYAASVWGGEYDVFENGPLLGGATRALGIGMAQNENRSPSARLYTYDWFSIREPLDLPADVWVQLIAGDWLTAEQVNAAFEQGSFLPLFKALHEQDEYWPLVEARVGYLPGHRNDVPEYGEAIFTAPDREFDLAFIDGCKSWYGTKHCFRELAGHLRPDTDVLFQDFGHYTCFWISSLIGLTRERWELRAYADHTYAWRLLDPPTAEFIEDNVPDEPTDLDLDTYRAIYQGLIREAEERGDRWCVMIHQAHLAAAAAYLGDLEESRHILDTLLTKFEWLPHRWYLKNARISPAYTPEARIEL